MEEAMMSRRERLKALKQAAQQMEEAGGVRSSDEDDDDEQQQQPMDMQGIAAGAAAADEHGGGGGGAAAGERPVLRFRNYAVRDEDNIAHEKIAPATVPALVEPELELAAAAKRPEDADEEELLASVAPKKANWDLKRELEPRLAKLERRTQRALVEIMVEEEQRRLQQEGGAAD